MSARNQIYICDIDGTIADISHRLHFIQKRPADWNGFFAACVGDSPIPEVIETIKLLERGGAYIAMVTGRSSAIQNETEDWLFKHGIVYDCLFMREAGDHRQDNIVKAELLDKAIAYFKEFGWTPQIAGVFEDRKQVVDMYRSRGLRVFQVADGNF